MHVSSAVYREIRDKLIAAGYGHAIMQDDGQEVLDMHGIAVADRCPVKVDEERSGYHGLRRMQGTGGSLDEDA